MKKATIFLLVLTSFLLIMLWFNRNDRETVSKLGLRNNSNAAVSDTAKQETVSFTRNSNQVDYSNVIYTPWDIKTASANIEKRTPKPYTIMIYMNGSDLESEDGAATDDLIEMLESGLKSENANLILLTGGTNRWQNDVVPENKCMIWEIADRYLCEIADIGLVNMGDAGTLASFIKFGIENFPAEKYGLILWDHGGGSIAGYGHDEKFNNANLTLLDMNYAFEKSGLAKTTLEFLGFDSCLMASVEMAVIASDYAKYLVASEDLTPGGGWDYSFLSKINENPAMNGLSLGKVITDYFMEYYKFYTEGELNMSVIDLSNVNRVMHSMGNLMGQCSESLLTDRVSSFRTLARKRSGTKTFGLGSPRDNESDMVDIGDMANKLSDLFPEETAEVLAALKESVVYNKHNSDISLSGLSTYYLFGGRDTADESLSTYNSLNMDDGYTGYLNNFSSILLGGNMYRQTTRYRQSQSSHSDDIVATDLTIWQPINGRQGYFIMTGIKNGIDINSEEKIIENINKPWPQINGKNVCIYKISDSGGRSLYAVPAMVNNRDCDIIIVINEEHPNGKILGARYEDGFIVQKGYDEIKDGNVISFYYRERYFGENVSNENYGWHKGEEFTVRESLTLDWSGIDKKKTYYSLREMCIQNEEHFTGLTQIY